MKRRISEGTSGSQLNYVSVKAGELHFSKMTVSGFSTTMWPWGDFVAYMSRPAVDGVNFMDALTQHGRELMGKHDFADDFSIVELRFEI